MRFAPRRPEGVEARARAWRLSKLVGGASAAQGSTRSTRAARTLRSQEALSEHKGEPGTACGAAAATAVLQGSQATGSCTVALGGAGPPRLYKGRRKAAKRHSGMTARCMQT